MQTRLITLGAAALAVTISAIAAFASGGVTVVQNNRSFNPDVIEIAKDTIVHFANEDEFIHQITSNPTARILTAQSRSPAPPSTFLSTPQALSASAATFTPKCGSPSR